AVDLPGHGFTSGEKNTDLSLPGVSAALGRLLKDIRVAPQYVVGHSAGAAILVHMCLAKSITPMKLISVNGALLPFRGVAGKLFPTLAKVLYLNPIVPRLLAWRADDERRIRRLIEGMGSKIDDAGIRLYTRLFQNTHHMKSTIKMMAYWDLSRLEARLADLKTPMLLITASQDLAVPAETSFKVSEVVPSARVELIRNGGHLVHEEYPERVCEIILKATRYAPNAS
ncbi:MAG: alpha/beta fold hydrolase, partial [Alphaproteobacteria bacterium]|nr:alpha/beta fold hydrolase [Alphaproteobacteria bacterium]